MADNTDVKKLRHLYADGPLHLYYDTLTDGTKVLRRIRVNQHTFATPNDGIIIDTVPPNSVDTAAIIDGAVEEQDLHDDVKDRMTITHDSSTGGLRLGGYAQAGDVPKND